MEKVIDVLAGLAAGVLLTLGLSWACDRVAGKRTYRYRGSGSPGRRAEAGLWDDLERRLDRAVTIVSDGTGGDGQGG